MIHRFVKVLTLVGCVILVPSLAFAQGSIVGVVRDTSGAVLPGVTVEAASPALIEKIRTSVTDGTGQYRVVDLRPGTYAVTFTLAGFNTVKREGIELSGNFTATVNVELRVGAVEETVTVTGESPTVDVQNTRQQQTIDREIIAAIPSGRAFQHIATLIPAMQNQGGVQDVGGDRGPLSASDRYVVHGGLVTDSRILVEGLGVGSADGGGASGTYYLPPVGNSQEVVVTTSGSMAEAETGGVVVNVIPREGGNTTRGSFFATGANHSFQSDNYSEELKNRGLRAPNRVAKVWEITPGVGGPLVADKLWYFLGYRYSGANNYLAGIYYNRSAGNPNSWTYDPDYSRQAISEVDGWSAALRLTWQASPRNKINIFWDEQSRCAQCPGGSATSSPEATTRANGDPQHVQQITWSSPLTNRILFEAGFGTYIIRYNWKIGPPMVTNLTRVTEQAGLIPGLSYRGVNLGNSWNGSYNSRASMAYVTGAHNMKFGYQGMLYDRTPGSYNLSGNLNFRFNNGVPNQLTQTIDFFAPAHLKVSSLYAQDQWTVARLTLQGGARYDHFGSYFPDQQLGPSNFLPVPINFPSNGGVNFNDVTPRIGGSYDVFGNGKTAVKASVAKYMLGQESSSAGTFGSFVNPIQRVATSTSRSWNDANRDYVPNCNLADPAANGECGAMANQNFGKNVFSVNFDPAAIDGWGIRPYQWEFSLSLQQELLPRVAANVGYFRRWYGNFAVTDNVATTAGDYTLYNLPVPVDPRLPNSGGVVKGLADVNPAKFGLVNNVVTAASNYGDQTQLWHGVDAGVNVRPQNGLFFQGGVSVGRTLTDNCEVAKKLPEIQGTLPLQYCRVESPFLAQYKGLWGYTIPHVDVQVSGTFQNIPGPEILANYNAPNAIVAPALGRNLSGGAANATVSLVSPMSLYGERLNQLDFRFAKIFRFGRTRSQVAFDIFNALNSNAVVTQNNTFGPAWQTPTSIHTARLAKISGQIDF